MKKRLVQCRISLQAYKRLEEMAKQDNRAIANLVEHACELLAQTPTIYERIEALEKKSKRS